MLSRWSLLVVRLFGHPPTITVAEIVFDAICRSQSGITDFAWCDERRAAYETAAGAFDAEALSADLANARLSIAQSYAVFPGSLILIQLLVLYKIDAYHGFLEYINCFPSVHGFAPYDAVCDEAYKAGIGSSISIRGV